MKLDSVRQPRMWWLRLQQERGTGAAFDSSNCLTPNVLNFLLNGMKTCFSQKEIFSFCHSLRFNRQTKNMGKLTVLFDLDGTLTDSKPGILNCLEKTLLSHNVPWEGPLDRFIGPPVETWTKELLPYGSEEARAALSRDYQSCYDREGWAENSVYQGIPELLKALVTQEIALYVCTSKPEHFARRILEKFELAEYFIAIHGDHPDFANHSKVDLMAHLLQEESLDPTHTWMVGDRKFDLEAAHANGVHVIAVSYGYGSIDELVAGNPVAVCATPAEVLAVLVEENSLSRNADVAFQQKA
jgi:phosphoglycolate phosphatase